MTSAGVTEAPNGISLEIPCELAAVRPATETLRDFLLAQGCAGADVIDCELAFAEACNNAVSYVIPQFRHLPVRIEASCRPHEVEMRVHDHTGGFVLPDKPALPDLESEGGRGMYVIFAVMKSVRYEQGASGNTLIMLRTRTL